MKIKFFMFIHAFKNISFGLDNFFCRIFFIGYRRKFILSKEKDEFSENRLRGATYCSTVFGYDSFVYPFIMIDLSSSSDLLKM